MRPIPRLYSGLMLAVLFWLADSFSMLLFSDADMLSALYAGVSPLRLLVRLLICAGFLVYGFVGYLGHSLHIRSMIRINKADTGARFGDAQSADPSRRMLYHGLRLASFLGMSGEEQENLRQLCYCYDMGMVFVPDSILEKENPTPEEKQRILEHSRLGAELASMLPELRGAARLIYCHEECYDGSGPGAIFGRSIPLACRIFRTVQLYDYLTHPHSGGRVMENGEALDELRLYAGGMLDPDVVEAFCRLMSDERLRQKVGEAVYAPQ